MVKYIKYGCIALLSFLMMWQPLIAKAQTNIVVGNNVSFEVGSVIDDNNCPTSSKGWIYIHDRSTGNKYYFYAFDSNCKKIQLYRNGDYFYLTTRTGWKYKRANQTTWNSETTSTASNYSVGIKVATCDLYVVVGGNSIPVTLDGICIWNPIDPSPTPTVPPTPTPIPVANVDMSETGFSEAMSVAMEFMRIPFQIAGFEITMFEIMMFAFASSLVIYLVFSPVKK